MKTPVIIFLLLMICVSGNKSFCQDLDWRIIEQIKELIKDHDTIVTYDLKIDRENDLVLFGTFSEDVIFANDTLVSNGLHDMFIAKYEPGTGWIWAKGIGGEIEEYSYSLAIDDNNNIIIFGSFGTTVLFSDTLLTAGGADNTDSFVAKYDSRGQMLWVNQIKCSLQSFKGDIGLDALNNIYITGSFSGVISFNDIEKDASSYIDLYIAKSDLHGNWQWVSTAGADDDQSEAFSNGIAVKNDGTCYITGFFHGKLLFGDFLLSVDGIEDETAIFIAKCRTDGLWDHGAQGHGLAGEWAYDIAVDNLNNCYIAGVFDGTAIFDSDTLISSWDTNLFLAKYSGGRKWEFARQTSGNSSADPYAIALDDVKNIFITGNFYYDSLTFGDHTMYSHGKSDIFLIYSDSSGNWLGGLCAGGPNDDYGYNLASDINGNIYFIGDFEKYAIFGEYTLNSEGIDGIIASLASPTGIHFINSYNNPGIFILNQNYPNPFNPNTTIDFETSIRGKVKLEIYNSLGEKISEIFNEIKPAGRYKINLNLNYLPSGMYFYKLTMDKYSSAKKMLLIH